VVPDLVVMELDQRIQITESALERKEFFVLKEIICMVENDGSTVLPDLLPRKTNIVKDCNNSE